MWWSHDPSVDSTKQQMPKNKGSVKVAKELMESRGHDAPLELTDPFILWAYKCRCKPIKAAWEASAIESADGAEVDASEPVENEEGGDGIAELVISEIADCSGVLPSELLSNPLWVSIVCRLFGVDRPNASQVSGINQEEKDRADMLVKILRLRMKTFTKRRKVSKDRGKHWAIQLANKNLSVVAAYIWYSRKMSSLICPVWMRASLF